MIWERYFSKSTKIVQKIHFWYKPGPKVKLRMLKCQIYIAVQDLQVKTRQEIKPKAIDDDMPTIIDLDTKIGLGAQPQGTTGTKIPSNTIRQGARGIPYLDPSARLPPRPPNLVDKRTDPRQDIDTNPNLDIEENSPQQEGIISETYISPDQSYFDKPQELKDLVDTSKIVQRYLPRQMDIVKILDIIKRKVLKGTYLPLIIKQIQAGYLNSLYFKDIYKNLARNELPSGKCAINKVYSVGFIAI